MPLTRISLRRGRSKEDCEQIMEQVYLAMRETFDVPEDDRFMMLHEHDAHQFDYGATYLDIPRTHALVIIQITANDTRSTAQKKALFASICKRLTMSPGLRPEDVFVSLIEVKKDNWSFGHGLAQYA